MHTDLRYRSHAKVNLYLEVLPQRNDGYHDIETIFLSVSLHDELRFELRHEGIEFNANAQNLGPEHANLAVRAARLLQLQAKGAKGAAITLDKKIPVAAGLAGGSGNAAATLAALDLLWNLHLPTARLQDLALALGSDVPFCLVGGYAAATGRGELLTPLTPPPTPRWFVLIHPDAAVSTPKVFNHPALEKNAAPRTHGMTQAFRNIVERANQPTAAEGTTPFPLYNRLETVTFELHPELAAFKQRLLDAGCLDAVMSGSGPTLIGLCQGQAHALRIANSLRGQRVSVVHEVDRGISPIHENQP